MKIFRTPVFKLGYPLIVLIIGFLYLDMIGLNEYGGVNSVFVAIARTVKYEGIKTLPGLLCIAFGLVFYTRRIIYAFVNLVRK